MDRRTIFTKTAKGLMEAKGQTSALPRDLRNILKEVDGKASVVRLGEKIGGTSEAKLMEALAKMEREGYVREFVTSQKVPGPPSQSPVPSGGEDLDFTSLAPKPAARASEYARRKTEAEEMAEQAAAARVAAEAAAKARAEAEAKAAAEKKARAEAEARARGLAEQKARAEAETRARAEAKAKAEAEARARVEAEARARREAEERARVESELKARLEEERRAREEVERKAKDEAQRLAREAEDRARREAEDKARREADELRAQLEAERKAREEAERRAREEAERREKAEARRGEDEQRRATEDEERKAREEAERREKAEAERRAKEDEERKAREEAERKSREEAEARRREEDQRRAREDKERKAREEAERREKAEAEQRAKEEEERRAREEEERRADQAEAERAASERQAKEDSKARAKAEAEAAAQARKEARARERARTKERKEEETVEKEEAIEEGVEEPLEVPSRPVTQAPVTEAPREKFRKPRNWARLISLGMFVLLIGALAAIHVMPIDAQPFAKAAQDRFGEPVRIGAVRFSLIPRPHLSFERVTIGTDPQLKIASISAVPELGDMFAPRKVFKSVEIDGLVLPAAFASRVLWGKGSEDALRVERVTVKKLKIELSGMALPTLGADAVFGPAGLQKAQLTGGQGGLAVTLQQDGGKTLIEIAAKQLTLPFAEKITLDDFSGKGTLGPQELTLREAEVRAYDGVLSGNARLSWRDVLSFEGEFTTRSMDAAKLAAPALSGGRLEGKGVYRMKGADAEKLMASAHMEGTFSVQKGTLGNVDLTRLLQGGGGSGGTTLFSEMNGSFLAEANRIQFRQIRLSAGLLSATGAAEVDAQKNLSGRFQVELRAQASQARATLAIGGKLDAPQFNRAN